MIPQATSSLLSRSARVMGLCALVALGASACNLRYDFTECSAAADCQRFDGSGTFYTCGPQNTCVVEQGVECRSSADCSAARPTCEQNVCVGSADMPDDMTGDMSPPDMGPDMAETSCTATSQCISRFDDSYVCGAAGQCVQVNPQLCAKPVYPRNGETDNVVFVASLLPLAEPFGTLLGIPLRNGVELAIQTFNAETSLPGNKKVAWISCDTKGGVATANQAAKHVINDIGVPAIIGPGFSESALGITDEVNTKGVFMIVPTATSPAITEQRTAANNYIWRNIASDVFQGAAFVKRIQDLGAQKLLILYKDDKYGLDLQAQMAPDLQALRGAENVKIAKYPNPVTFTGETATQDRQSAYSNVIVANTQTTAFKPDVVIIIGTSEGAEIGALYVGLANNDNFSIDLPSRFVFSHGATPNLPDFIGALGPGGGALLPITEGIAPDIGDPTSPQYVAFAQQYAIDFDPTASIVTATTTFDSTMVTLLAACAIPDNDPINGKNISNSIIRLVNKQAQEEDQITFFQTTSYASKACQRLKGGGTVDLTGVSGALDYDINRGEVYSRFIGWGARANDAMTGYELTPKRVLVFTDPPNTDGSWAELP